VADWSLTDLSAGRRTALWEPSPPNCLGPPQAPRFRV